MTGRPILFSGPMVRALLDGRKTQTRRVLRMPDGPIDAIFQQDGFWWTGDALTGEKDGDIPIRIKTGDRLWVRESLKRAPDLWTYSADGAEVGWPARQALATKRLDYAPSIHMPKVASRLTLTVTDVRVQRLQDISEEDARAEGAYVGKASGRVADNQIEMNVGIWFASGRTWYADLWDRINGAGSWAANPWVVAYSFTVEHRNIDPGASS